MDDGFKDLQVSEELKKKLEKSRQNAPDMKSLRALEDIADMLQEFLDVADDNKKDLGKFQKEAGTLLVDMRESLEKIAGKEQPEMPDYAKPIVEAVKKLEKAMKVEVKAPDVNVQAPKAPDVTIDMESVVQAVRELPTAFNKAIASIPEVEIPETDFSGLEDRMDSMLEWLESIDTASRMKPQAPKEYATNSTGELVVEVTDTAYATQIATDSGDANVSYIGKAAVGSATSSAVWQIKEVDENSGTVITFADGNSNFDNVWDNRESLTYS